MYNRNHFKTLVAAGMQPQSHENLQQWLAMQQHRLVALNVALDDMARVAAIPQQQYLERRQYIRAKLNLISHISAIQAAESLDKNQVASLGLPQLQYCSRNERQVCAQFLTQRLQILRQLQAETSIILQATRDAIHQNPILNFLNVFRLSKMRRLLSRLEYCMSQISYDEQDFNNQVTKLLGLFQKNLAGKKVEANLHGLMSLFQDLAQINLRISRLQNAVAKEQDSVNQMELWLNRMIAQEHAKSQARALPLTPINSSTADDLNAAMLNPLANSEKRLVLAREFVESCLTAVKAAERMYQDLPPLPDLKIPAAEDIQRRKPGKKKRRK